MHVHAFQVKPQPCICSKRPRKLRSWMAHTCCGKNAGKFWTATVHLFETHEEIKVMDGP